MNQENRQCLEQLTNAQRASACYVFALSGMGDNAQIKQVIDNFYQAGTAMNHLVDRRLIDKVWYNKQPVVVRRAMKQVVDSYPTRDVNTPEGQVQLETYRTNILKAITQATDLSKSKERLTSIGYKGPWLLCGYFSRPEDSSPTHMWLANVKTGYMYDKWIDYNPCRKRFSAETRTQLYLGSKPDTMHPSYEENAIGRNNYTCVSISEYQWNKGSWELARNQIEAI